MSTLSVDTIQGQTTAANVKLPAGSIVQFVEKTSSTVVTQANNNTLVTFGLSQAFTPKFASSTIFLMANIAAEHYGTHTDRGLRFDFTRDGSQIRYWPYVDYHSSDNSQNISTQTLLHSESAGSTSARTYEVRFCCTSGSNSTGRVNNYNAPSRLVIIEVAG